MVWENLPAQLAKENKKFVYSVIRKGARAKDFELALQWLTDAGLLHKIYNTSKSTVPLKAYQELSNFKIFHNDVGLLGAMAELSPRTIAMGNQLFEEFKGAMTEQFVLQQRINAEKTTIYYHTFDKSKYEIDFLIQNEADLIIPIEVKAGTNTKATSFQHYCERNNPEKAVRFSLLQYKEESWMTNYPIYTAGVIE